MRKAFYFILLCFFLSICLGEFNLISAAPLKSKSPKAHTSVSNTDPLWVTHARRLSGESDAVRNASLEALKKFADIDQVLTRALQTPYRYLALDAISALSLKGLLPELFKIAKDDSTGAVLLAINTMIDSQNVKEVQDFYGEVLQNEALSSTLHLIAVDTLSRLQFAFSDRALRQLLESSKAPEVQHSVMSHLRRTVLLARMQTRARDQARMSLDLLDQFFERAENDQGPSRELLLQALFFYRELNAAERAQIKNHSGVCRAPLGYLPFGLMNACAQLSRSLIANQEHGR